MICDLFVFLTTIEFSTTDKDKYPWLKNNIRYYQGEDDNEHAGGMGVVVKAYVADDEGNVSNASWPKIAVKSPNLKLENLFSEEDVALRLFKHGQDVTREFRHIRNRLEGCDFANPILDFDMSVDDNDRIIFKTAQRYIQDGLPLKEWLTSQSLRPRIVETEPFQKESWHGILTWNDWRRVALIIANAMSEIHQRRVIHGDVWPDNIYISEATDPYSQSSEICESHAILIDFGEAFLTTPYGTNSRHQNNHPYRAPERGKHLYIPTEQVDVYSFGKVLLYLATGEEIIIPEDLYGRDRRTFVRDLLIRRNQSLLRQNPAVVDIISRCTAYDAVMRPKMHSVVKELERGSVHDKVPPIVIDDVSKRLSTLNNRIATQFQGEAVRREKLFLRIIDQKLDELDSLIGDYKPEQIDVGGTREDLIDSMSVLFKELSEGDSWTTLTTPEVWQSSALGLDGRYASATIEAVKRNASVRRVYAICVEEMGTAWASKLAKILQDNTQYVELQDLGRRLEKCVKSEIDRQNPEQNSTPYILPSQNYMREYQRRIKEVVDSQQNLIETYGLLDKMFDGNISDLSAIKNLCLTIVPVATRQEVQSLRIRNPVSLVNFGGYHLTGEENWILVMTDIRGRISRDLNHFVRPHLLGYRVYKSVMGYPKDRVIEYTKLFQLSVNIGPCVKALQESILAAG